MAVAAALLVLLFAVLLLTPAPQPVRLTATGVGMVGGALAMAAGFRMRAMQAGRAVHDAEAVRRRRAWNLVAVASALAAVSNVLLIGSAAAGPPVDRGPSDIALGVALLAAAAGIAAFPLARRRATDLARMALDGVVLAGSALFVLSVIVFPQLLTRADDNEAFRVAIAVAGADVVIGTVVTLLFLRAAPPDRPPLGLAAVGFFCYAASDFAYAMGSGDQGTYTFGTIDDLGWILGYALFAVAAHSPGSEATPHDERPVERMPVLSTIIMFCLFLGAVVFSLIRSEGDGWSPTATGIAIAVLLAVMGRQVLLIVDNDRLRRDLELRVEQRTRALRQVSEQSRLLVASVGDGIYGVDAAGIVDSINPAAAEVLGYAPEALIGREAHATFHAKQPDGSPYPFQRCFVTGAITEQKVTNAQEDSYLRSDGLVIPVEVTATPLIDDGRAIGAVVVFRDVTQRREVDRMKSEFCSIVSHELRTPVTAIHGALGLLAGGAVGELNPSARRMIDIARVSSERLGRLINEILDVERIESGMLSMELGIHACRPLIESAVSQMQVLAHDAGIRLTIGATEGQVHADADRLVQTLLNLLGNAIKFSHPGGYVSVRSEARGEFVQFAIRDHGRGIPEDKLDEVFSRFHQVDSSDAREKGGFGLGLSISRGLVERLGGRIWAENNADAGATFLFTLPSHAPTDGARHMPSASDGDDDGATLPDDRENLSEPAKSRF